MEKTTVKYERIKYIGEGQFAVVYKAKDTINNRLVAVKKIKFRKKENETSELNKQIPSEIKLLQQLQHENVINLLDVVEERSNISLVLDYMDTDLEKVIKDTNLVILPENLKAILEMTLKGLEYLHSNWILHRDLKPNNLLLNADGIIKIADFGLARNYGSPNKVYTHQVATRWYRAPELLFGSRQYGTSIDIWSVGCIVAELLLRQPFLPGESDLDQLTKIFEIFGSPTEENWPGIQRLPDYINFENFREVPLQGIFTSASTDLIELLKNLFLLCPTKRSTASQALEHFYFKNQPSPAKLKTLPKTSLSARRGRSVKRRRLADAMEIGTVPKKLLF